MPAPRRLGPLPLWPYFFLAALAAVLGAVFLAVWWPWGYPDESELVKISGDIDRVAIRDDISKSGAGAMLPALTSVYFTLEGRDEEFRYPSTHPKYPLVRDYTAVAIDVWVVEAEMGRGAPVTIWQIQERNPHDDPAELTQVGYAETIERLTATDRSMVEIGYGALASSVGLLGLGMLFRRWNRGRVGRLG
jgi:hypothetical protein